MLLPLLRNMSQIRVEMLTLLSPFDYTRDYPGAGKCHSRDNRSYSDLFHTNASSYSASMFEYARYCCDTMILACSHERHGKL